MLIKEIIFEAKPQTPKPRNFVAKNAINTGAGAHKDKKKAAKQGDVKHKSKAVAEDSDPLDKYRKRVHGQGFSDSPEERTAARQRANQRHQEKLDKMHKDFMSRGGDTQSDYNRKGDERWNKELDHASQQRMNRDAYDTQRRKDNDEDWRNTFDMQRDRINRYQWATQRDVDPDQLAKISAIKYEPRRKKSEGIQSVAEGSAHGYNVTRFYRKYRDQSKITRWLKKEAGLPKETKLYFDDADLVLGSDTIVPYALVDENLKFNDLLTALVQATGGIPKEKVDGVYRDQGMGESATAGATSAANVAIGPVYKNKTAKTAKNKDGTAKNALDMPGTNLITGGSIKRR